MSIQLAVLDIVRMGHSLHFEFIVLLYECISGYFCVC